LPVPSKPPRFSRRGLENGAAGGSVAYRIRDTQTGGRLIYAPDVMALSGELAAWLNDCDLLLFDGTLWSETEMQDLQISRTTARDMGHLPISGDGGSLNGLREVTRPARVYVHINNTNPILLEHSPERAQVRAAGWTVGEDGMEFNL
jgi:pyrroloquinoline quinone biosynthesis protein B